MAAISDKIFGGNKKMRGARCERRESFAVSFSSEQLFVCKINYISMSHIDVEKGLLWKRSNPDLLQND